MTTLNSRLQLSILNRKKGKNLAEKGFTLIEIMVVVAIVGVLSAVALPQLTKAQDRAKSSAAQQEVVNQGKTCSIALLSGETYTPAAPVTGACTASTETTLVADGGGKTYTVTVNVNGIPSTPVETETPAS